MKKGTPNLKTAFGRAAVFASSVEFEEKAHNVYVHLVAARKLIREWTKTEQKSNSVLVEFLHETLTEVRESLPINE